MSTQLHPGTSKRGNWQGNQLGRGWRWHGGSGGGGSGSRSRRSPTVSPTPALSVGTACLPPPSLFCSQRIARFLVSRLFASSFLICFYSVPSHIRCNQLYGDKVKLFSQTVKAKNVNFEDGIIHSAASFGPPSTVACGCLSVRHRQARGTSICLLLMTKLWHCNSW